MKEYGPDELYLTGRVQVETALGALAYSGINSEAEERLETFLEVHAQMSDGISQNDLSIYVCGKTAETEKADILTSLSLVTADQTIQGDMRLAAQALREILQ